MSNTITFNRGDDVLFRQLEDEIVLYRISTGDAAVLDQLGSLVWQCLLEPASIADLVPDLAQAFAVDSVALTQDLTKLFDELSAKKFIVEFDPEGGS